MHLPHPFSINLSLRAGLGVQSLFMIWPIAPIQSFPPLCVGACMSWRILQRPQEPLPPHLGHLTFVSLFPSSILNLVALNGVPSVTCSILSYERALSIRLTHSLVRPDSMYIRHEIEMGSLISSSCLIPACSFLSCCFLSNSLIPCWVHQNTGSSRCSVWVLFTIFWRCARSFLLWIWRLRA